MNRAEALARARMVRGEKIKQKKLDVHTAALRAAGYTVIPPGPEHDHEVPDSYHVNDDIPGEPITGPADQS